MSKDFLSIIVEHKKSVVNKAKKVVPQSQLVENIRSVPRNKRSFIDAFKDPGVNIIAEIKRASPSKGNICIDLNPSELAVSYEKGGAKALSVLTEEEYFKGSFEDFRQARQSVSLPVLRKDFIISSYQIYESAYIGADAILLIARILSTSQLKEYMELASDLDLDALVEIHSENDLESANEAGAKLIGINNRNLSSFETDLNKATSLASGFSSDQVAIAASGISGRTDIEKNLACGINNFLIGESLVRARNTEDFLKSLRGSSVTPDAKTHRTIVTT